MPNMRRWKIAGLGLGLAACAQASGEPAAKLELTKETIAKLDAGVPDAGPHTPHTNMPPKPTPPTNQAPKPR
jgi:hypothetical protein